MLLPLVIPLRDLKGCQIQKHNINRLHNPTLSSNYSQNLNSIRIFIAIMLIVPYHGAEREQKLNIVVYRPIRSRDKPLFGYQSLNAPRGQKN